jgi:hypothetical protein
MASLYSSNQIVAKLLDQLDTNGPILNGGARLDNLELKSADDDHFTITMTLRRLPLQTIPELATVSAENITKDNADASSSESQKLSLPEISTDDVDSQAKVVDNDSPVHNIDTSSVLQQLVQPAPDNSIPSRLELMDLAIEYKSLVDDIPIDKNYHRASSFKKSAKIHIDALAVLQNAVVDRSNPLCDPHHASNRVKSATLISTLTMVNCMLELLYYSAHRVLKQRELSI